MWARIIPVVFVSIEEEGRMKPNKSIQIVNLSSRVKDTGRRGNPKTGCDCVACFGYCQVDSELAVRERAIKRPPKLLDDLEGETE
jgi:hypothetical protein